jgi:hypothetical protein
MKSFILEPGGDEDIREEPEAQNKRPVYLGCIR